MIRRNEIYSRFQKLNRMIGWRETERAIFTGTLTSIGNEFNSVIFIEFTEIKITELNSFPTEFFF